jgi:hypothetical protein
MKIVTFEIMIVFDSISYFVVVYITYKYRIYNMSTLMVNQT